MKCEWNYLGQFNHDSSTVQWVSAHFYAEGLSLGQISPISSASALSVSAIQKSKSTREQTLHITLSLRAVYQAYMKMQIVCMWQDMVLHHAVRQMCIRDSLQITYILSSLLGVSCLSLRIITYEEKRTHFLKNIQIYKFDFLIFRGHSQQNSCLLYTSRCV